MDTTLIPMNTAQIGNTLTDLGTYIGAYFPAFLGLALFFAALIIVFIVVKGILNWIVIGIKTITYHRDIYGNLHPTKKAADDYSQAIIDEGY